MSHPDLFTDPQDIAVLIQHSVLLNISHNNHIAVKQNITQLSVDNDIWISTTGAAAAEGQQQQTNWRIPPKIWKKLNLKNLKKTKWKNIFSPYHPRAWCDVQSGRVRPAGRNPGIPGLRVQGTVVNLAGDLCFMYCPMHMKLVADIYCEAGSLDIGVR